MEELKKQWEEIIELEADVREEIEILQAAHQKRVSQLKVEYQQKFFELNQQLLPSIEKNGWEDCAVNGSLVGSIKRCGNNGIGWINLPRNNNWWARVEKLYTTNIEDNWMMMLGIDFEIESIRPFAPKEHSGRGFFYHQGMESPSWRSGYSDDVARFVKQSGKTAKCFIVTGAGGSTYGFGHHQIRGVLVSFNQRSGKILFQSDGYGQPKNPYYENSKELEGRLEGLAKNFQQKVQENPALYMIEEDPYIRWYATKAYKESK